MAETSSRQMLWERRVILKRELAGMQSTMARWRLGNNQLKLIA
jgi:hypothetical protein